MVSDTVALRIGELESKPESLPVSVEEWDMLRGEYEAQHGKEFPKTRRMTIEGVKVYPVTFLKNI